MITNEAPRIPLPGGGIFMPDIVAQKGDKTIFIEVERETSKDIGFRQSKWKNFFQVCGGEIYVICDNRDCMRRIRAEINRAIGNLKCRIYLTNIFDLQEGKRGEDNSLWLSVKTAR